MQCINRTESRTGNDGLVCNRVGAVFPTAEYLMVDTVPDKLENGHAEWVGDQFGGDGVSET